MTALIAIYGAILSTLVAALQIRNFYLSQKFVHVKIERTFDLEQEYLDFVISNQSNMVTEIREVMIGIFGAGGKAGFHMLWGTGAALFKGAASDDKSEKLKTPTVLQPGETVVCRYSSTDAIRDIQYVSKSPIAKEDTLSNLFYIEVEHSRSNKPKEVIIRNGRTASQPISRPMARNCEFKKNVASCGQLISPKDGSLGATGPAGQARPSRWICFP